MPTYTEIAFARYKEIPNKGLSLTPAQFRISFLSAGYVGTATELEVYANSPCKISKADSSQNRFEPIHPLKAQFSLRLHSVAHASLFYVHSDRQMQVIVTRDPSGGETYSDTVFCGWVLPTDLSFDYKKPPFALDLSATDGLAGLKERPFVDRDGKRFKDFISPAHVLRAALEQTGFALSLETGMNLYELADVAVGQLVGSFADPARDSLYELLVRAESFTTDAGAIFSCYDAIKTILTPFGLRLSQLNGKWVATRADECAGGWDVWNNAGNTIHTRLYSDADPSENPTAHQSRNLNVSAYPKTALQVLKRSPKVGLRSTKNGVRVEQSFGRFISKLPNFEQVDGTGLPLGFSVNNISIQNRFRVGTGTEAEPYALRINGAGDEKFNADTPAIWKSVDYPLESVQYTRYNKYVFSGKARLFNIHAGKLIFVIARQDGSYLWTGGEWKRMDRLKRGESVAHLLYNSYKDANGRDKNKTGWFDYTVDLGTIDRVRRFTVYYCVGEAANKYDGNGNYIGAELGPPTPYVDYQAGDLVTEKDGLRINGTQLTFAKPGTVVKDTALTLTLGDIPDAATPYDRTGTLFHRHVSGSPVAANKFYRPDADITDATPAPKDVGKTLLRWTGEAYARQQMFPAENFEGVLIGRLLWGPHSVIHIADITNTEGATIPHQITRWEWDTRACEHTLSAEEMLTIPVELPAATGDWQTPDGAVPMDADTLGNPVLPTDTPGVSPRTVILRAINGAIPGLFPRPRLRVIVPGFTPIEPNPGLRMPTLVVKGLSNEPLAIVRAGFRSSINLSTFGL